MVEECEEREFVMDSTYFRKKDLQRYTRVCEISRDKSLDSIILAIMVGMSLIQEQEQVYLTNM